MIDMYSSGLYLAHNPDWHVENSEWKAKQIIRIIDNNKIAFDLCVEVGCGAGRILEHLSRRYQKATFVGCDVVAHLATYWNGVADNRVSFVAANFADTSGNYDLLLLIDVFEHVADYLGFLKGLSQRAKYFIFHIPLDMNVQGLLRDKQIEFRDAVGHLHYFSQASALRTLEDSGYEVMNWFYTAVSHEAAPSNWTVKRTALNLLRRAVFPISPDLAVKLFGGYSMMVLAVSKGR